MMADASASPEEQASGRLHIAQRRLTLSYPFHAHFVSQWQCYPSQRVTTIGVTLEKSGLICLLYNPDFVVACSLPELCGVLHHEVHHLLFEHPFADPDAFPDRQARLIAEEVSVNEWIREPLPGAPIVLEDYPQLPENEDTNRRYERLAAASVRSDSGRGRSKKRGQETPKTASGGQKSGSNVPKSDAFEPKMDGLEPLDDHSLWGQARACGAVAQQALRMQIRSAADRLAADEWQQLPRPIQQQLASLCYGKTPGGMTESLSRAHSGRLNWREVLRRYVAQATERRPVFHRPPRRFPNLVGVVPGHVYRPGKPVVMAVIDTSGSMDSRMLEAIVGELDRMRSSHRIEVVECDAKVQRVYRYRGELLQVQGRGGTDLRAPLTAEMLGKVKPDVVIYFTDGDGPAPPRPPTVPVIWCLTPDGKKPSSWGREVRLKRSWEEGNAREPGL